MSKQIPKIDEWRVKGKHKITVKGKEVEVIDYDFTDAYCKGVGENMELNLDRIIPSSKDRMSEEDKEARDALKTFMIERSLFSKKVEFICQYIDYFIEFFDEDKELPLTLLHLKKQLDIRKDAMDPLQFLRLFSRSFFRDTSIKQNIYRMVDYNYDLDITVDKKTGRRFDGIYDFTNDEAKNLLAISMFLKIIIPVTSQYISTNTTCTDEELSTLTIDVFVECFYKMGDYNGITAEDLLIKLYKFTEGKISKHYQVNKLIWNQQSALRGLTEDAHIDTILIKHLLGNNMFKFKFDDNIISFLKSIVETQLICTINKLKYKVNPVLVDSTKDANGMSGTDKLEQSLAKWDETQLIRSENSIAWLLNYLEKKFGPVSEEEIQYYEENFLLTSIFHKTLLDYHYAKVFDGFTELKSLDMTQHVKLLVYAKRDLIDKGNKQLPWLLSSVNKGRLTLRLLRNSRYINKLEASEIYDNLMNNTYPSLKGFDETVPLAIISQVMNNNFTYVEYEHQDLTGKDIVFDEDIISDEVWTFYDNI